MQQIPGGNANSRQSAATFAAPPFRVDEQTLMAMQQMGFFPQLFQNSPSSSSLDITAQQNELLKEILKAQLESGAVQQQQQQQNKATKEVSRRRPSLMHDSGASVISHNDVRPSQHSIDSKKMIHHHQLNHSADTNALIGQPSMPDPKEEEDEKKKRMLSERLDRIERERIQAMNSQKNAQKKARTSEAVLRQEPLMLAEEGKGSATDSDEETEEQSPADALIERIYAENRRKAAEMTKSSTVALSPLNQSNANVNNCRLKAEDMARLSEEYERGIQLLPMLVQAMRIQRERRQDALENRRIIYEEQLTQWERKVTAYERSQKKIAKDVKHRELFEKTFVELRKLREEKERNTRVERSRFSLAQGGNGIPSAPSETLLHFVSSSSELPENEQSENDGENVHEKAFTAAIVPPTYVTRPSHFFDNRNSIVENPLADTCAQIEAFQNQWTDLEKDVFMEKVAIYGKNFAAIAAFLPSKSVKECVQFYYMTKKRNNYKQKIGRRRKKIGRQGYRPPVMPRFGDSEENVQLRNYGRECTFVECLLCSARILVLESLSQLSRHEQLQSFDHFGPVPASSPSQQQQIPICTKCQTQAQRNRTLNRCPLGICACVGGKRKMRPVRNVPEKFASLGIEHKRFLISRLKIPPSTSKCCTNCFKRISKDIDGLLLGELKKELEEFNNISMVKTDNGTQKPSQISGKNDEETENLAKSELGEEMWTTIEGPPVKELKLETKDEEEGDEFDEVSVNEFKTVPMETDSIAAKNDEHTLRPQFGSLTKGIPNRKHRPILIGAWDQSSATVQNLQIKAEQLAFMTNIAETFNSKQNLSGAASTKALGEDFAAKELASAGETKCNEMAQIARVNFTQREKEKVMSIPMTTMDKDAESCKNNGIQRHDNVRRKSGLANALLPSPLPDAFGGPSNRLTAHRTASPAFAPTPNTDPLLEETTKKGSGLTMTLKPTTQSPSCYESLSDESDSERGGQEALTKKSSSGLCPVSAAVAAAPLNFFSLLDLMDESEPLQQRRTMTDNSANAIAPSDACSTSSFATVSVLHNQHQQQRLSMFAATAAQWEDANKRSKTGAEQQQKQGEAECVYEPLSEDET